MISKFSSTFLLIISSFIISSVAVEFTANVQFLKFSDKDESCQTSVITDLNIENENEIIECEQIDTTSNAIKVANSSSKYLPQNFFSCFRTIKRFIFEDSQLIEINPETLRNFTDLIEISFHKNNIKEIKTETFKENKNLQKLTLSANQISTIEAEAFSNLAKLQELYLNDNEIAKLNHTIFRNNKDLQVITLDNNLLTTLPYTIFNDLKNLKELRLDHNELKFLSGQLLYDNENLKIFTVYGNKIEKIGEDILENFRKLEVHDFRENTCLDELERGYDFEELEKIIKENCKVEYEEENQWLKEELREKRTKRNFLDFS